MVKGIISSQYVKYGVCATTTCLWHSHNKVDGTAVSFDLVNALVDTCGELYSQPGK